MERLDGRAWGAAARVAAVCLAVIALAAMVACEGGKLRREIERETAAARGLVDGAQRRASDAKAAGEARALLAAQPADWTRILEAVRPRLTDSGRRDLDAALASGMTPTSALESVGTRAELAARPLIDAAREAGDRIEALAARLPAADAGDDRWWGLGETGAAVLAVALPGLGGVIGGAFGLARGVARGRRVGAEDVTELVASLRRAVPAIDRAFGGLPTAASAAAMAHLPADVAGVIDAGKTEPNHAIVRDVAAALAAGGPAAGPGVADTFPPGTVGTIAGVPGVVSPRAAAGAAAGASGG